MNKKIKDGRKLRSQSTSDHILSTIIKLAREGNKDINFDLVAKETKLGARTIFRHFKDKDTLLKALHKRIQESTIDSFPKISEKESLIKRMNLLISYLCDMYSINKELFYWTAINIVQSEQVYKNAMDMHKLHRKNIIKILPEIKNKDEREQEAILHILSFGFWKNMSFFSKKKNKEIEDILLFNLKKHLKKR